MTTAHHHPVPLLGDPVFRASTSEACGTASGIYCECHHPAGELQLQDVVAAEQRALRTRAAGGARARGREGGGKPGGRSGEGRDGKARPCVLYEEEGGIATLTLNRPKPCDSVQMSAESFPPWAHPSCEGDSMLTQLLESYRCEVFKTKHSFNRAVFSRLAELLQRAERSESVLAVILTGAGGYFTSGADIKELQNDAMPTVPMLEQPFGVFSTAVLRFPKLLVAAVNGPAVGVGVTLLPHCDVVYAYDGVGREAVPPVPPPPMPSAAKPSDVSASAEVGERQRRLRVSTPGEERQGTGGGGRLDQQFASFWTPFFRLAIVPEFCSSVTFPEILGWPLANEMLVMGRKLSAREALASGLVSTVVTAKSESEFLEKVKLELRRNVLTSFAAAESVGIFKQIMWRERRPRLLRIFAEECAELDRRVQGGRPKAALKHLARQPPPSGSKL